MKANGGGNECGHENLPDASNCGKCRRNKEFVLETEADDDSVNVYVLE